MKTKIKRVKRTTKKAIKKPEIQIGTGAENEIDVLNLGTLLQLETSFWQGSAGIEKEIYDKSKINEETKKLLRTRADIIDRKELKEIITLMNTARTKVNKKSLPFPIRGVHFIPNNLVEEVEEYLQQKKIEVIEKVNHFSEIIYPQRVKEAKENRGDLFDVYNFPLDIRSKFSFNWRYFSLTLPPKITTEMYIEEHKKFKELMEETRNSGVIALREGFSEIVNNLIETLKNRMSGKSKRIRQERIDGIMDFFDTFESKNIFKDDELRELILKAKKTVHGLSAQELGKNKNLMKNVCKSMSQVNDIVNSSIVEYKRRIKID